MKTVHTKRAIDLFKPLQKGDRLTVVYLYADGHASAKFERRIKDADQTVDYYKQVDNLGIACRFSGRLIFHSYSGLPWLRAMLACGATALYAADASPDHGSEETKRQGIAVGHITASTPFGDVTDYTFPRLISGGFTYQGDVVETFDPDLESYGFRSTIAETLITRIVGPINERR